MNNLPVIAQLGADIVVAIVVNEGTKGDAAKKAARAQALITAATAAVEFFSGSQTAALATLAAATSSVDPAITALVTNVVKAVTPLAQIEQGTLVGSLIATQAISGLNEMISVAQKYVPPAAPATAPVATPAK